MGPAADSPTKPKAAGTATGAKASPIAPPPIAATGVGTLAITRVVSEIHDGS